MERYSVWRTPNALVEATHHLWYNLNLPSPKLQAMNCYTIASSSLKCIIKPKFHLMGLMNVYFN